jgi:hypothetical protein
MSTWHNTDARANAARARSQSCTNHPGTHTAPSTAITNAPAARHPWQGARALPITRKAKMRYLASQTVNRNVHDHGGGY